AEAAAALDGHLLVIDDDEPMLRLAQLFLEDAGFEVTAACGGHAALAAFQGASQRFDGVVLDLSMPDVGGERVLEEIRRQRPELPVIVMSGYAEDKARDRLGAGPHTSFLHKPFEPEELIERLRSALGRGAPSS
ncbi:MAG: response regulator, partial [Myxococcota bacterium]